MSFIGIDWGTTQLRAHRIGAGGEILESRHDALGIAAVRAGRFEDTLDSVITGWPEDPILMCGMVGSRHGWLEAPYNTCPTGMEEIARNVVHVGTRRGSARIIGGLTVTDERGHHDVMRGEETQILGAAESAEDQLVITPGTHSKWTVIESGRIRTFRTYLTGELYSTLRDHSSLGWAASTNNADCGHDTPFLEGITEGRSNSNLLHSLFSVRTRTLFESWAPHAQADYLSGILIGSEVQDGLSRFGTHAVTVIASEALSQRYRAAFAAFGIREIRCIDADATVARGLWRIHLA